MKLIVLQCLLVLSCNSFAQNVNSDLDINQLRVVIQKYSNDSISVEKVQISDWRWAWYFYNRNGEKTFEMEEILGSYRVTIRPIYREDGSVKSIENTINPGGSRFWHKNTITMDSSNTPLTLEKRRLPVENLSDSGRNIQIWNPEKKRWE